MMHKIPSESVPEKMLTENHESTSKIRITPAGAEIRVIKKIQGLRNLMRKTQTQGNTKEKEEDEKLFGETHKDDSKENDSGMQIEAQADNEEGRKDMGDDLEPPEEFKKEFVEKFTEFLVFCKNLDDEMKKLLPPVCSETEEQIQAKMGALQKVYFIAGQNYYEANALQIWPELTHYLKGEEKAIVEDAKLFYHSNLFLFEKFSNSNKTKEEMELLLQLDVTKLTDPYILKPPYKLNKEFFQEVLEHQAVLLKDYVSFLDISPTLFSVEHIAETHAQDMIDVVFQNPHLYGFVQDRQVTFQYKKQMSIGDYFNYQQESLAQEPQNIKDEHGMIKFAVNIDIETWKKEMNELLTKIPKEFLFNSEKDAMTYSKQSIKGINLPQLYMKVEGAWTGGHEENLRLRAINFNHGPGNSVWFTIHEKHAKAFRKLVKDLHGIDIHKDEGLWFADIDTCIKNGIEIQYFVQEPGDVVALGPGCLHWVRCTGIATNSAWNFCTKDKIQFEKGFERYYINREIDFKSIIPLRHIAQQLLFKETFTIPKSLRLYLVEEICKALDEELQIFNDFKQKFTETTFFYENEGNAVYNCTVCNHETFNFFVYCHGCSKARDSVLICLKCYETHLSDCRKPKEIFFYYKISPDILEEVKKTLKKIDELKKDYKNFEQYLHKVVSVDRKKKLLQWEKKDSMSNEGEEDMRTIELNTKPFDKRKFQSRKYVMLEGDRSKASQSKMEEIEKQRLKIKSTEKTPKKLIKPEQNETTEKVKQASSQKVKSGTKEKLNAFEESVKAVKEMEEKKLSSVTRDPPFEDEDSLKDDEHVYRIKKKSKMEENSSSQSTISSLSGSSLNTQSSGSLLSHYVNLKSTPVAETFVPKISGAHDNFFLGRLCNNAGISN